MLTFTDDALLFIKKNSINEITIKKEALSSWSNVSYVPKVLAARPRDTKGYKIFFKHGLTIFVSDDYLYDLDYLVELVNLPSVSFLKLSIKKEEKWIRIRKFSKLLFWQL